eukprot:Gregarina_sp_Pseudo_9__2636@NODE_2894_length_832_cov_3209_184111_g2645_i0_p1_GENE_NODE_2894_length_832_cov_3209_184111_g2645_i0NODE_2894_length_832_cov_3209_184111_g2645_i0_p1_ORF_typecomplete_len174_score13_72_NODE_2894_length_832_cov_3209_184111_g2645_i0204725
MRLFIPVVCILPLSRLSQAFQATFTFSNPDKSHEFARDAENATVTLTAIDLSHRVCAQYSDDPEFCNTLAQAVDEAEDHEALLQIPFKLAGHADSFSLSPEGQNFTSPLPQNLDMHPGGAWGLHKSTAPDELGSLMMDSILSLASLAVPGAGIALVLIRNLFFSNRLLQERFY